MSPDCCVQEGNGWTIRVARQFSETIELAVGDLDNLRFEFLLGLMFDCNCHPRSPVLTTSGTTLLDYLQRRRSCVAVARVPVLPTCPRSPDGIKQRVQLRGIVPVIFYHHERLMGAISVHPQIAFSPVHCLDQSGLVQRFARGINSRSNACLCSYL